MAVSEENIPWRVHSLERWRDRQTELDMPARLRVVENRQRAQDEDTAEIKAEVKAVREGVGELKWTLVKFGLGISASVVGAAAIFAFSVLKATGSI